MDGRPAELRASALDWRGSARYSLRVSHWSGQTAQVELHADWIYSRRFHEVFGRATYRGQPVYGFSHDSRGAPTDSYGRLLYLDTLNSSYGSGWRRENAFLSHAPTGVFCNGFYPHGGRGTGVGSRYRLRLIGPGVTPDVEATVGGLHDYRPGNSADAAYESRENHVLDRLAAGGHFLPPALTRRSLASVTQRRRGGARWRSSERPMRPGKATCAAGRGRSTSTAARSPARR